MDYFVYRAAGRSAGWPRSCGGIDGLVFTAGIGENSPEIRRRICEASAWLGIELDAEANTTARRAHLGRRQPRIGVGYPDERRADDRPPYG